VTAAIPLRLGPLGAPGYVVRCSGLRWLCDDGQFCRPNQIVAFCNVSLVPDARAVRGDDPFVTEQQDFQVGLAPRIGGRLRRTASSSRGGFLDQLAFFQRWSPDYVIGHLEAAAPLDAAAAGAASELRLLLGCGRRTTGIAEGRNGFMTGWHDRSRAWWSDTDAQVGTLLSLGICEQGGIVRGDRFAFLELFEATRGPAQIVFVPDDVLVPCAGVLVGQMQRTTAEAEEIAADMARALATGPVAATPGDWIFTGALLAALARSPLTDRYDVLARNELRRDVGVDAVLLSLHAETTAPLRHRRLGYLLKCHHFRLESSGRAVPAWLQANFEPVERSPDEVKRDLVALIDAIRDRSGMRILILNCMSTNGFEDVHHYAAFDRPMGRTLATIRDKELNLMLHDLARERDVAIVDTDAIAADIGAGKHLQDGVHASGLLQAETRAEIARILHARGVPGFAPAGVR
jgi:hypothetical protein